MTDVKNTQKTIDGDTLFQLVDKFAKDVEAPEEMVQIGPDVAIMVLNGTPALAKQLYDMEPETMLVAEVSNGVDTFHCLLGKFIEGFDVPIVGLRLADLNAGCIVSFAILTMDDGKLYPVQFEELGKPVVH